MSLLTEEQKLEYCRTCTKRKFTLKEGIVCSLTKRKPEFESTCPTYEMDEVAFKERKEQVEHMEAHELSEATGGLSKVGIKTPEVAGIIIMAGSFGLSLLLLFGMGRISLWLIISFVFGVIIFVRGIVNRSKKNN